MSAGAKAKVYEMTVPGSRERFATWIAERGGIAVWPCVNLSNLTGPCFTPALTDGKPTGKPGWQYGNATETVTDLARFRFATGMKEVARFRVALRMGGNGMSMKLTDGASRRLNKRLEKAGDDARYRFDYATQEAVIEVPVW
jgi:hypothetical protein